MAQISLGIRVICTKDIFLPFFAFLFLFFFLFRSFQQFFPCLISTKPFYLNYKYYLTIIQLKCIAISRPLGFILTNHKERKREESIMCTFWKNIVIYFLHSRNVCNKLATLNHSKWYTPLVGAS